MNRRKRAMYKTAVGLSNLSIRPKHMKQVPMSVRPVISIFE